MGKFHQGKDARFSNGGSVLLVAAPVDLSANVYPMKNIFFNSNRVNLLVKNTFKFDVCTKSVDYIFLIPNWSFKSYYI